LREISKRDPELVFNFLLRYINSHEKNIRWIVREGSKKLPRELRNKLFHSVILFQQKKLLKVRHYTLLFRKIARAIIAINAIATAII